MKKYIKTFVMSLCVLAFFTSCDKDNPDTSRSIFDVSSTPQNPFDKWLYRNYVQNYNLDFKYRMEDIESDRSHNLVPAELEKSMKLAKLIKYSWLEAYVEAAGIDFMRKNAPGVLHIVGSAAWNSGGTMTLGTAEGGMKITLYLTNWLDQTNIDELNHYFFHTMHHEFTHILQQAVYYPLEYNLISAADYNPSGWQNRRNIADYASLGFVTAYAGSNAVEDITEVTSCYITFTDQQWKDVFDAAGEEGKKKLNEKIKIMKTYMKNTWKIDMDQLRSIVHRRMREASQMDLLEPDWKVFLGDENSLANRAETQAFVQKLNEGMAKALQVVASHPNNCHIHDANLIDFVKQNNN